MVDAAADLMYARGVARTSLDEVLATSGTSKSQLYHYFDDKDALVEAVIARQTERVLAAQAPHLPGLDSVAGIRAWCAAVVDQQQRYGCVGGCPLGSLASELADISDPLRRRLRHGFQRWEQHLVSGLGAMQERGELAEGADVHALAAATMAALQGGLLLAQTTRSTGHLEAGLAMAVDHIARHAR